MQLAEKNYGIGEKELLAIVMACKYRRHYLEGVAYPIQVFTDHLNLQTFMTTESLSG